MHRLKILSGFLLAMWLVAYTSSAITATPSRTWTSVPSRTPITPPYTPTASPTLSPTPTVPPTQTPRPIQHPSPTAIPLAALPTLPPGLPRPPLGYRWAIFDLRAPLLWLEHSIVYQTWQTVEALSPADGQVQWRYEAEGVRTIAATTEGVFVLMNRNPSGEDPWLLVALQASNGQVRWQQSLPELSFYETGYSLTADARTLYVNLRDYRNSAIFALDTVNGQIRWQQNGCRLPWLTAEDSLFATCPDQGVVQFDSEAGEVLARAEASPDQLTYADGVLVLVRAIRPDSDLITPPFATELIALRWPEGSQLWEAWVPGAPGGLLVDEGSLVYRAGGTVYWVHLRDGRIVWETNLPEEVGTNLMRVGDALLVGSGSGHVHALDWATGFRLWGQDLWMDLGPRHLEVTVLGIQDETLFARIGYRIDSRYHQAVAALVQRGETAWPTPTPTPRLPTPTSLPLPRPTSLRPDWTPTPPSPKRPTTDDFAIRRQAHIHLVMDLLNATQGDVEAVLDQLAAWWKDHQPYAEKRPPNVWAYAADLDDDGVPELLISIPILVSPDTECGISSCRAYVVVFEREEGLFAPVHIFGTHFLSYPQVLTAEDLNGDSKTELVLRTHECGAHTCIVYLQVGRWDGQHWHDLGSMRQTFSEITLVDQGDDGTKEIVMYGGIVASVGAGLQRKHTLIYGWQDGRYRLLEDIPDSDPCIYFRMLDANAALVAGDIDQALNLAMDAVMYSDDAIRCQEYPREWGQVRIISYAAIEAMLVHALRHEPGAMEALLHEVETKYNRLDNPYVEAARRLVLTYQETQDPVIACEAMERAVRERLSQARFFRSYGYNMEQLPLKHICPLDGDLGEGDVYADL